MVADSEGPDQTARMRSLIWAFAVRMCPKALFYMAWPIWLQSQEIVLLFQAKKKKKKKKKKSFVRISISAWKRYSSFHSRVSDKDSSIFEFGHIDSYK